MKRLLDLMLAIGLGVILAPVFLLSALLVLISSGTPILYKQKRIGKDQVPFQIYKFRSMRPEISPRKDESVVRQFRPPHAETKSADDPRITRWGKFMRKFSIDELPQIANVLRGEMSFVGPRPYLPEELDLQDPRVLKILSILPGITGWWQVNGRNELDLEERLGWDQRYVEEHSMRVDLAILIRTGWVVLSGGGR